MDEGAPKPTRSRKEEYRAKVHAERRRLPFQLYDSCKDIGMILGFAGAGFLLFRKEHYVGGLLVCLAGLIAFAFVARTYFKEATRRPDAAKRRRKRRTSRSRTRTGRR